MIRKLIPASRDLAYRLYRSGVVYLFEYNFKIFLIALYYKGDVFRYATSKNVLYAQKLKKFKYLSNKYISKPYSF